MSIRSKINELRYEESRLSSRISHIKQEIRNLQQQCDHGEGCLVVRESMVLERWLYDEAYSYDSTGQRVIEKRYVHCECCVKGWTEMRYTDDEWIDTYKWEERARDLG